MLSSADLRAKPASLIHRTLRLVIGPPLPAALPRRVQDAIRREQEDSEIIITLIQFAAIGTFFILYSLTPKAFPDSVPFEPVPIALTFYMVFTLIRFGLAIRRQLPAWFLALSVVVDIGVLMLTIWSFHLQYGSPPSIYFKAPTLMYVFILIGLRMLRFEPGYVVLCGIAAALGWSVLVAYAFVSDHDVQRTHSFADYAISHDVLLGAEFDRIVSILMVTAILALALHRGRKLLARAVSEQQAASDLARFFAPEVAGRITMAETDLVAGRAELREAAILFIDLRNFTALAERLPPADVMRLLSVYQSRMVAVVRAEGGSIDKFMGDGILASFGATRASASFAADAVRTLEGLVEAAARMTAELKAAGDPPLAINASVACGRVMFGTVGDAERLEYTVIGEPVNLAAKLEKHCKAEEAIMVMPTAALTAARAQGLATRLAWDLRPARLVAGVAMPLDLAVLPLPRP